MTVQELSDKLKAFPPESEIVMYEAGYCALSDVVQCPSEPTWVVIE